MNLRIFTLAAALSSVVLLGCGSAPQGPPPAPMTVPVAAPVQKEIVDFAEYVGRIEAVDKVEVRARVSGYLQSIHFKEGQLVEKGALLAVIDPRPYVAELNRAKAQYQHAKAAVEQAKAQLAQAEADEKRMEASFKYAQARQNRLEAIAVKTPNAVTKDELEERHSELLQAQAQLEATRAGIETTRAAQVAAEAALKTAEAAVDIAQLNLDYTKVTAPIRGKTSRYSVTVGNMIDVGGQGGTVLTTIVSVDPIYAYFDVEERTVNRIKDLIREADASAGSDGGWPVTLGLAAERTFPFSGRIDFIDNQVNPRTGTLRLRAVLDNPEGVLMPGFFARIRVPVSRPHAGLLVSDRALTNDQGQKVLLVVNEKSQVAVRPIRAGALHDGLRTIEEGLLPGDLVIVNGLQYVRPGDTVQTKVVPMPATGVTPPAATQPTAAQATAAQPAAQPTSESSPVAKKEDH